MPNQEVTTNEIMDFLVENMATKGDLENMATKKDLEELRTELRTEIRKSEQNMMDFVDDKLADLKGDLVVLMRKEDTKVMKLIEILKSKAVLNEEEAKTIMSMEPFAKLFV